MKILITADDFGVNASRTDGILAVHEYLSQASLLVNGEDVERAVHRAKDVGLPLALHLNVTEGTPCVLGPSAITGSDGCFLGKAAFFCKVWNAQGTERDEIVSSIVREYRAQLRRFIELTGCDAIWLDGHHHAHVLPAVLDALLVVAEDFPIVGIRLPHDSTIVGVAKFDSEADCFGLPFWASISSLAEEAKRRVPLSWTITDAFIGFDLMGCAASQSAVFAKLCAFQQRDSQLVVEWMTHVGMAFPSERATHSFCHDAFSCSSDREHEMTVLIAVAHTLTSEMFCGRRIFIFNPSKLD